MIFNLQEKALKRVRYPKNCVPKRISTVKMNPFESLFSASYRINIRNLLAQSLTGSLFFRLFLFFSRLVDAIRRISGFFGLAQKSGVFSVRRVFLGIYISEKSEDEHKDILRNEYSCWGSTKRTGKTSVRVKTNVGLTYFHSAGQARRVHLKSKIQIDRECVLARGD